VAERLPHLEALYAVECNPIYAWQAYEIAREGGSAIPDWVLEYFDFVADNIGRLAGDAKLLKRAKNGDIAPLVSAAAGFVPGGAEATYIRNRWPDAPEASREKSGAFNPVTAAAEGPADMHRANAVVIYLALGRSLPEAKRAAASAHGVKMRTIDRALEKYPLSAFDKRGRLVVKDKK
jgi:hypothetical protein